ncbi:MAG TPA: hypothetical protein VGM98_22975 [Schlesneria sp.]
MRTFFYGWRRKAGVVTLVMALAFMGLWMRSRASDDELAVCGMQFKSYGGVFERSDFMFLDVDSFNSSEVRHVYWRLQYAWFAFPLTLLSAYLILVPSRKQPPATSQSHA